MKINRFLYSHLYSHFVKLYLKLNTNTTVGGLRIKVLSGVFHPKLFFSSTYLFDYINTLELNNCNFLEIGSGTGALSVLAYKKGAIVTAIDIDKKAVENTRLNFIRHFGQAHTAQINESDLFKNLPVQAFDLVLINPPYFFKEVERDWQQAWYCGAEGEYFKNLFAGLSNYIHSQTDVIMILADNCDIERIKGIAKKHHFLFAIVEQKKVKWEMNFIFRIEYHPNGK
ncbi:MAG: methyltransferase [Bacteroidia bacterium]|nr:methyltransferase [Bacteroidia bacterium]